MSGIALSMYVLLGTAAVAGLLAGGFVATASYLFFWYEHHDTPHGHDVRAGRSQWAFRRWLAGRIVVSFFTQLAIYVTYPLFVLRPLHREFNNNGPAVLFVHGLYHNASAWLLGRLLLWRQGWGCSRAITYFCFNTTMDALVERLRREIADMASAHPDKPLYVVTHSMGGVLLRAALADPQTAARVHGAALLAAPHGGSRLACLGIGHVVGQLQPQSDFMRALADDASRTPRTPCPMLALHSPVDNMVMPVANLLPPKQQGWINRLSPPTGHIAMLFTPSVLRMAFSFLQERYTVDRATGEDAAPLKETTTNDDE